MWDVDCTMQYDLARTDNEFQTMNNCISILRNGGAPEDRLPVVTPYLCSDLSRDGRRMKIFVTQWSRADEQWSAQFADGEIDSRVTTRLAKSMARLHSKSIDPSFNNGVREYLLSGFAELNGALAAMVSAPPADDNRTLAFLSEGIGAELYPQIWSNFTRSYSTPECMIHNDLHMFNILVEKKPLASEGIASLVCDDGSDVPRFGPHGDMTICDWEMSHAGPRGKDVGTVMCWPIACAMAHASQGNGGAVQSMLGFIAQYRQEYLDEVQSITPSTGDGVDAPSSAMTFQQSVGWAGFFILGAYIFAPFHYDLLPFGLNATQDTKDDVRQSLGFLVFNFWKIGFSPSSSTEEGTDTLKDPAPGPSLGALIAEFDSLLHEELQLLLERAAKNKIRPPTHLIASAMQKSSDHQCCRCNLSQTSGITSKVLVCTSLYHVVGVP